MRILLVITRGDSIGGAQLYLRDLAARLGQDGHEVLVATGTEGPLCSMLAERGIATVRCHHLKRALHPAHDLLAIRELVRVIHDFQPDLVSAHSSKAGIVARLASRIARVPCIFTAHGWAFADGVPEPGRTVWRLLERGSARLATRIICVSRFDRDLAVRAGFDPARLTVIHNGVAPAWDDCPSRPAGGPVRVVMVARFFHQKDHRSLLKAVAGLPDCELDLVGDGPLQPEMETLAETLGIRERVRFHGYVTDISGILARASVFALISRHEGFPLTTLEAMRTGLPAIVSDVGGAGEAVIDGVTGYLVPREDVTAIRSRLRSLIDQPSLRIEMGAAAQASFSRDFTFDRMYDRTLAVYQNAAAPSSPQRARGTLLFPQALQRLWRSPWA